MQLRPNFHKVRFCGGKKKNQCVHVLLGCGQALQNRDTVHLMAGGEHQSQDCDLEGVKAGAQRCAWASVQPCGVRGNKSVPTERERCTAWVCEFSQACAELHLKAAEEL